MSTLICTLCGQVRVETSRSVVLPYVCPGCAPLGTNYDAKPVDEAKLDAATDLLDEVDNLSDDTATTSATIEMIADLENQLTVAKDLTKSQTELIDGLEKQNTVFTSRIAELDKMSALKDVFITVLNDMVVKLENENGLLREGLDALERVTGTRLLVVTKT